jgi:excisionase family DNA binding protein
MGIRTPYGRNSVEEEDSVHTEIADDGYLLTTAEVATMFRVDPKTVGRWAKAGRLTFVRTLGGHRRYRESEVRARLRESLRVAIDSPDMPPR